MNLTIKHDLSAEFILLNDFVPDSKQFTQQIIDTVDFEQFIINDKPISRRMQHFGPEYSYFKMHHPQKDVPMFIQEIINDINLVLGTRFNSVLLNLYPNEKSTVAWHADDEKVLGSNPKIASLSLGATRLFHIRDNRTFNIIDVVLEDNMLLYMGDKSQINYQHCIPKAIVKTGPRINLTFREIL